MSDISGPDDDSKVVSIADRLRDRTAERQAFSDHMDRLYATLPILREAIVRMRREIPGITWIEVAQCLENAGKEIRASEQHGE